MQAFANMALAGTISEQEPVDEGEEKEEARAEQEAAALRIQSRQRSRQASREVEERRRQQTDAKSKDEGMKAFANAAVAGTIPAQEPVDERREAARIQREREQEAR